MTTAYPFEPDSQLISVLADGVYAPQEDSKLLIDVMDKSGLALGSRVADLCTGSGVVAINAAAQGARHVAAFDICPSAVRCARANAQLHEADVDVHLGSWARALEFGPYDLVVSNPPYVPHDPSISPVPPSVGPARAWDAGNDGRMVLDPLCAAAPELLADGGTLLVVQSEFSNARLTLEALSAAGLDADIVAWEWIPFGPVMHSRAQWLEDNGRLQSGRREEELMVIRADKP